MISTRFNIPTASTGAMLRREVAQASPVGIEADHYTAQGGFVPDELVLRIVATWLNDHAEAFILDGFPRTVAQAEALQQELHVRQSALDVAFLLELPESEIRRRVLHRLTCDACGATFGINLHGLKAGDACPKCGGALSHRKDDTEEVLSHRLAVYRAKTLPIADFYESRGLLRRHDANISPEKLFETFSRDLSAGEAE